MKSISTFVQNRICYKIFLLLDVFLITAFFVFYFFIGDIYKGLTRDEISNFKTIYIIAAFFSVVSFPCSIFGGVIQAYEEYIALKLIDICHRVVYIVVSALAIWFGWGLFGLVFANFGAAIVSHCLRYSIIRWKLKIRPNFRFKASGEFVKNIFLFSAWAAIQSVAARLVFNVMPSLLGIVSDSENIAIFGFIATLESYVYTFGAVMSSFFLPKIARILKESNDRDEVEKLAVRVGKMQLILIGLVVVGFVCCGKEFCTIWLKDEKIGTEVYFGTALIISYQLVFIPEMVYLNEMYLSNKVKQLAIGAIAKAGLNLALAIWLGSRYGAKGASIAVFVSRIFELLFNNVAFKICLKARLGPFFAKTYLRMLPAFFFSMGIGLSFVLFQVM